PREMSESGMLVYPQLPVPKQQRDSIPQLPNKPRGSGNKLGKLLVVLALAGGAAGGFYVRPLVLEDSRVVDAEAALAKEKLARAQAGDRIAKLEAESQKLDEQRELLDKQVAAAKQAQDMLADKQADAGKLKSDL